MRSPRALPPRSWRALHVDAMHGRSAPRATDPSVLVVDDETGVRELMARWLASGGYDVRTAAQRRRGAAARARRSRPRWRCATSACRGTTASGSRDQIRHDAPETAVIMATGVQDVGSAVTSLRQGVIDYLTKPFGRDRLRESVVARHRVAQGGARLARWREALEQEVDAQARAPDATR